MSQVTRKKEIMRRRRRRNKIRDLRRRLGKAKNQTEIQRILKKIRAISPFYPMQNLQTQQNKTAA